MILEAVGMAVLRLSGLGWLWGRDASENGPADATGRHLPVMIGAAVLYIMPIAALVISELTEMSSGTRVLYEDLGPR